MLLQRNRLLLLSLVLLLRFENTAAKERKAEVHMAPMDNINTGISITKDKKQQAFEHRQQHDRQSYDDFIKEQEAEEKFLYGHMVHSSGTRIQRDHDKEGDQNTEEDEEGALAQGEDGEDEQRKKDEEEEAAALTPEEREANAQNIEEKRKEEIQLDDFLMGILSLAFVSLITVGLWQFYRHFLDNSNTETKSLIHSQVIEAAAASAAVETPQQKPEQDIIQNSMGRSYERLKSEYVKRKQQATAAKGNQKQSPPTTPSTGVSTRYGTQTDASQQAARPLRNQKTYETDSDCGERTGDFVFPTRHFVAQTDVELQEQDLQ